MLRLIIAVTIVNLAAYPVGATTDARQAQELLFRLGYEISVDGAWGPQSDGVMSQFLAEQGLSFDGVLDINEISILQSSVTFLTEAQSLLPIEENSNGLCEANIRPSLRREVLAVEQLRGYQSIPTSDSETDLFLDTVNARLYQWTAGALSGNSSDLFKERLIEQIKNLAAANVGRSIATNRSVSTVHLIQTDYLLTLAYSVLALTETNSLTDEEFALITNYLKDLVYNPTFANTRHFSGTGCTSWQQGAANGDPFSCQNHTYGKMHLRAVVGFIFGREDEIRKAINLYRYAINDLSEDGALWREAARGAYSWTYYPHALGHLVGIADLVSRSWFDLWSYQSPIGLSIHDAVSFYAASMADPEDPELMHKYAQQNLGIDAGRPYADDPLSLGRYERLLNQRYYSEWLPVYLNEFPTSDSGRQILNLLRNVTPPTTTYHYGLNTWCTYPAVR